jgi:hypothetical protein
VSYSIEHRIDKGKFKKEYFKRLRLVLGAEFSTNNKIETIGSRAAPELRYTFGIINRLREIYKN